MISLYTLRVVCLVLWVVVAIALAPSFIRSVRGKSFTDRDEYATGFFFTALLFIGSIGRWLLMPDNEDAFAGIYALTAALAAYVLMLTRQGRRK